MKNKPNKSKPAAKKSAALKPAKKASAKELKKPAKVLKKQDKPDKPDKKLPKPAAKMAAKPADSVKKNLKKDKTKKAKESTGEVELEDTFETEDFDGSEIAEYEDDLKAVEEDDSTEVDSDAWAQDVAEKDSEEVFLTDAEGNRYCRARDCDQISAVDIYCRYHYLLFWKKIQVRKKILQDGKLERYVEELTARYPDKFLEMIRRDLRTEKDFQGAIQELEIDEAGLDNEMEEDTQTFIDEVRGMGEGSSTGVEDEEF